MLYGIIAFLLGVAFWTFLEYVIHRFILHKKGSHNPATDEHLRHHREGGYFAPFWKKLIVATAFFALNTLLVAALVDLMYGALFSMGTAGMYILYEVTHKRLHAHAPLVRYGMIIRKHHFYHHFVDPKKNHGVTVRFWDRLFGTFSPTVNDHVPIPRKMILPWLVDASGMPESRYLQHFSIR